MLEKYKRHKFLFEGEVTCGLKKTKQKLVKGLSGDLVFNVLKYTFDCKIIKKEVNVF